MRWLPRRRRGEHRDAPPSSGSAGERSRGELASVEGTEAGRTRVGQPSAGQLPTEPAAGQTAAKPSGPAHWRRLPLLAPTIRRAPVTAAATLGVLADEQTRPLIHPLSSGRPPAGRHQGPDVEPFVGHVTGLATIRPEAPAEPDPPAPPPAPARRRASATTSEQTQASEPPPPAPRPVLRAVPSSGPRPSLTRAEDEYVGAPEPDAAPYTSSAWLRMVESYRPPWADDPAAAASAGALPVLPPIPEGGASWSSEAPMPPPRVPQAKRPDGPPPQRRASLAESRRLGLGNPLRASRQQESDSQDSETAEDSPADSPAAPSTPADVQRSRPEHTDTDSAIRTEPAPDDAPKPRPPRLGLGAPIDRPSRSSRDATPSTPPVHRRARSAPPRPDRTPSPQTADSTDETSTAEASLRAAEELAESLRRTAEDASAAADRAARDAAEAAARQAGDVTEPLRHPAGDGDAAAASGRVAGDVAASNRLAEDTAEAPDRASGDVAATSGRPAEDAAASSSLLAGDFGESSGRAARDVAATSRRPAGDSGEALRHPDQGLAERARVAPQPQRRANPVYRFVPAERPTRTAAPQSPATPVTRPTTPPSSPSAATAPTASASLPSAPNVSASLPGAATASAPLPTALPPLRDAAPPVRPSARTAPPAGPLTHPRAQRRSDANHAEPEPWPQQPAPSAIPTPGPAPEPSQQVPSELLDAVRWAQGVDVSDVPIRREAEVADEARALGARSFTRDAEVFLPSEHGSPHEPVARGLLAHELTHAAQQRALGSALPAEDSAAGRTLEAQAVAAERWARGLGSSQAPAPGGAATAAPWGASWSAPWQAAPPNGVQRQAEDVAGMPDTGYAPAPDATAQPGAAPAPPAGTYGGDELGSARDQLLKLSQKRPLDLDDPGDIEELSMRIYQKIHRRLRRELLVERERAGRLGEAGPFGPAR